MLKRFLPVGLLLALLLSVILPIECDAQVPLLNAKVSSFSTTYVPLTSWNTSTGGTTYYATTLYYTLPYNFYYDNQNLKYITMSGSGGLGLFPSSSLSFYTDYNIHYNFMYHPTQARYTGAFIYPWFCCMYYNLASSPQTYYMYIYTSGTTPDRVTTFEWREASWVYTMDNYGTHFNFQVKLYETSNIVEIIYGDMKRGTCSVGGAYSNPYYWFNALVGFTGYYPTTTPPTNNYINLDPRGNGNCGYKQWEFGTPTAPLSRGFGAYETIQANADLDAITKGEGIRLTYGIDVLASYPSKDINLRLGYIYGNGTLDPSGYGDNQRPGITLGNVSPSASVVRQIMGPMSFPVHPNYKIIYDATNSIPDKVLTRFSTKTGVPNNIAFGSSPSGALDLKTNESQISGGYYHLVDVITYNAKIYNNDYYFNIAGTWDLQIFAVVNPRPKLNYMYPITGSVPLRVKVVNRGINNIANYYAIAKIYNSNNELIYQDSVYWEAGTPSEQMKLGDERDIDFASWNPSAYGAGDYKFEAYVNLAGDVETWNNYWPWKIISTQHFFRVAPEFEGEAVKIIEPVNVSELGSNLLYYVGRPVAPRIRYRNNGISDISNASTNVVIKQLNTDTEVYNKQNIKVSSIAAGLSFNTTDMIYDPFTPLAPGDYEIRATIDVPDDEFETNNTALDTFTVENALNGTYTIGPNKNTGNAEADKAYNDRNFTTIIAAVNELYQQGITGPVVFEFTTNSYICGDVNLLLPQPALDLRTKIQGMSADNTVTFRPSATLMAEEGAVTVRLYSNVGVGIIFGQSLETFNTNAIINNTSSSVRSKFANSDGYFIFDGGTQRALKFILHSTSAWNAAFYLSQGASNITIKNCVITSNTPATSWTRFRLPVGQITGGTYYYEKDWQSTTVGYQAGIALRSIPPMDNLNLWLVAGTPTTTNTFKIDTLVNKNNIFSNNKISGFSFGIVSMGIGPLSVTGLGRPVRFYNYGNTYSDNIIYNVRRAGIFLGHEENSVVKNNRISNIATTTTGYNASTDVAGIQLGGERTLLAKFGYNNINITLDGNEISNIGQALNTADRYVYGILVEQVMNDVPGTGIMFPDVAENFIIKNNVIWGLRSNTATANKIGIRLTTERLFGENNVLTKLLTPEVPNFFTSGSKIVNNTLLLSDDGYASTTGAYIGIMLQNNKSAELKNNAIAMMDNNNGGNSNIYAAIFYQGFAPSLANSITSNRNIYYQNPGTDKPPLFRFINISSLSKIINLGSRNEFATLNQWYNYSKNDELSGNYNFVNELTTPDITSIVSKLRINSVPSWPQGSKLNNRGENLDYVLKDIDGNQRGLMSQRYDIGAFEFPGILLNSDAEITAVSEPGAYFSTTGPFSDAEHIMTKSPVDVAVKLTNNGKLPQTGMKVTCKIYRENPAFPGTFYTNTELEVIKYISLESGETYDLSFNLDDNIGKDFSPSSYSEWNKYYEGSDNDPDSMYIIPAKYATMQHNVTPLYKISVNIQNDENISNNVMEKNVRFYLKRSKFDIILSAENTYQDDKNLGASEDVKAGRRNYDSLVAGLARLGWINKWNMQSEYPVLEIYYDVFERSAWEPRAVDYSFYRTLIWSDVDENPLAITEKDDITKFVKSGTTENKRNLIVGSQEMARLNYSADSTWVKNTLYARFYTVNPTNPNGGLAYTTQDNVNNFIIGQNVGRGWTHSVLRTVLTPTDMDPIPALLSVFTDGLGLSRVAYSYNPVSVTCPAPKETAAGVANITITANTVYLGIDWRHYGTIEYVLRAVLDFLNKNGGNVIPVELISFDARNIGNRVELLWETAGEINSSRFDVERATLTPTGNTAFVKIAEEKAAGKSSKNILYGPVVDNNLVFGNTYVYRLKMIDLDGKFQYSSEIQVTIGEMGSLWLGDAVPNPAKYESTIGFSIAENSETEIAIYDLAGKKVMTVVSGIMNAGSYTRTIDLTSLTNGYYSIVMISNGKTIVKQLNVSR
jgi:hypothetical protein